MKALVTGGGGFVGEAVVRRLLARGDEVTVLNRRRYPDLEAQGAAGVALDLATSDLEPALEGHEVVFHVAAKTGVWGRKRDFVAANVTATRRLLDAAQRAGVSRFVHTSSPSVTFDGADAEGVDEAAVGYPKHFEAHYPATKAAAERLALAAHRPGFSVCALRPHLVWGPKDPHLFPRVIDRARRGRLLRVGEGQNRVALTHVEHAADAHLKAADALGPDGAAGGKAYFITDGSPVSLWTFIDRLLFALGLEPVRRSVSAKTAYRVGALLEALWRTLPLPGEPPMTRFVARELASSHWYDITAAETDLGYRPFLDIDAAFNEAAAAFRASHGPTQ